jgi:RNA polymerase sigma-70 factor (ECF subfamily)
MMSALVGFMLELAALVRQQHASLVRFAARYTRDNAAAQDVVQEAYLRGFLALERGGFEGRSSLKSWLFSIVRNVARDEYRRRARFVAAEPPAVDGDAFERIAARAALARVRAIMDELPGEQREALVRRSRGASNRDVADELACSEGAVEQRLVRARAALRRRLAA